MMDTNKYEPDSMEPCPKEEMIYFNGRVRKHLLALVIGAGLLSVLITPFQGLGYLIPIIYYFCMWGLGYILLYLHCRYTGAGKDER